MNFNFLSQKYKNIFISAFGAFLCMFLIAYFNSIDSTNVWLIPPFGASLVLVMAVHESPLASPRNVFFGHVLSASSGVLMFYFLGNTALSIALGLGFAISLMMLTKTVHPPAGANPVIAVLGAKTFEFVIMPVAIGASFIVIFALLYNKIWKR
ncbi:HPP family protein [Gammaproteobacteria bacterium]|jgi:CBS-domain-containing membrane protein|nr:HPP family protein [Gammaproteobacteria bacterium]|tara:strand:- start:145 stop:603 length:459 start_codon:yes stop_codon:yes gene_type:complete